MNTYAASTRTSRPRRRTVTVSPSSDTRRRKSPSGARATGRRQSKSPSAPTRTGKSVTRLEKTKEGVVRFAALGGFEEIGRNMMFFEYGDEIVVIDAGLQFPEENTPGIDYIIPDVSYLKERKENIKALIVTHGHYDHIGALPHVLESLGNPPIYTTSVSREIIQKRQTDFPNAPKLNFHTVTGGDTITFSPNFKAEFFSVFHNIPDGIGIILHTPGGKILHPGEFKFDYDTKGEPMGLETWKWAGEQDIQALLLDSTASEVPGWSISERVVEAEIEKIFKNTKGRIIVATFASLLDRLAAIITIGEKHGRKVALSGYSLKTNVEIVRRMGYMKVKDSLFIDLRDINKLPDEQVLILSTGGQGEPRSSLTRIANGEHKFIQLKKTDTIIFSSSVIPGNEHSVQVVKDNLARQCRNILHNKTMDIHSSGHAPMEELKTVMKLTKPKYFIPMHGHYFMRVQNATHAREVLGLPEDHTLIPNNGEVLEISKDGVRMTGEEVPCTEIMVDGLGVGDVEEVVLRDRRNLAEEGMIVAIVTLDRSGRVIKNPDIISRGFIYLKDQKELLGEIRSRIRNIMHRLPNHRNIEADYAKTLVRSQVSEFIFKKTGRRPMVLPVIIQV